MKRKEKPKPATEQDGDIAETYNAFKEFEGRRYTGMKIGRSHHWRYDQGEWTETKLTPEEWGIHYAVTKRRAGHAPDGSGVPVGTSYHWYILAHQNVTKLNANDYSTSMTGVKFKLAHKRAGSEKWSATMPTQRKHLIQIMKTMIEDLEKQDVMTDGERPKAASAPADGAKPAKRPAVMKEMKRDDGMKPARPRAAVKAKHLVAKPSQRIARKRVPKRSKTRRGADAKFMASK